jgi:hypothetical protein
VPRRCSVARRWPASASMGSTRGTKSTSDTGRGARCERRRSGWRPIARRRGWSSYNPVRGSADRPCAIRTTSTSRPSARRRPAATAASGSGSTPPPTAVQAGSRSPTASPRSARPAVRAGGRPASTLSRASCRPSTAPIRRAARGWSSRDAGAPGPWRPMPSTCATRRTTAWDYLRHGEQVELVCHGPRGFDGVLAPSKGPAGWVEGAALRAVLRSPASRPVRGAQSRGGAARISSPHRRGGWTG